MPPKSAPQLAPEQIEEVKEAFNLFDVDSSGAISYKELRACMKALQIKVDKDELKKMILEVDADQSGEIEFPEFLTMMTGKMAQNDSKDEILKVYKMFDVDGDGAITFASLKRVARVRSPRPPALSCRATPFPLPRVPPSRALRSDPLGLELFISRPALLPLPMSAGAGRVDDRRGDRVDA